MAYSPRIPNAYDDTLIPVKIRTDYFEEYIGLTPLFVFMGTGPSEAIQTFEINAGEGGSYRLPLKREIDYKNPIRGYNQAVGNEQQLIVYEDELKYDILRFPMELQGKPLVKIETPLDLYGALRPSLINAQKRNLIYSILNAGTSNLYNSANGGNGPKEDRAVYAGAAYNASIYTACDAMAGATYDANGLSVAHLRKLKSMAITGGTVFEREAKIRPVELTTRKGFPVETYVYLMDTDSYISLSKDPEWKDFVYRGVIQTNDQPEGLSGARYRGTVEGIMVYECPELAEHRVATSANKVSAWNLFLGAQAFGVLWAKRPWFVTDGRDFGFNVAMSACEIRGEKALMFPSFQNPAETIERGIIHSFVQLK